MENETYKKATELLEKYAPNRLHKLNEVIIIDTGRFFKLVMCNG